MMKLIQNIDVYAPQHLGKKDVLTINDKIVKIKDAGSISADGFLSEAEIINGEGLLLTPGFIDSHVHVLGGGGEGGFANRTPEATMEGLTKFGVTTVVGCLGTDGIGRDMCALVAKTKGLNEQGMSAYCYTGSYQIPVRTLTDSIVKDIMMIQEIIGTGEIAISDHRSSQPTFEEFTRVIADTRLGGVLSGKAGIVNVHLGDSPRCLDLIERVVDETEIPASQILPTHINRNEMLFGKSIEYALKGGAVDFTGNEDIDYWETICDEVRVCNGIKRMLDAGVNPDRITISSDGQGSLPMYSSDGEFLGMGVGQSSCLLKEVKECVFKTEIPLEIAISTITSNPADILRLKGKGKVEEGYDADLCILDQELQLVEVIADIVLYHVHIAARIRPEQQIAFLVQLKGVHQQHQQHQPDICLHAGQADAQIGAHLARAVQRRRVQDIPLHPAQPGIQQRRSCAAVFPQV